MNKYMKLTFILFVMGLIMSIMSLYSTIALFIEQFFPVGYIPCMLFSIGIMSCIKAIIENKKN